ncbi:ATP-binding protein, partial [Chloroflexota bacterium]
NFASTASVAIINRQLFEEIEKEKNQSIAVLSSMDDGVIVTDADNRILMINPSAKTICSCISEESIGRNVDEILSVDPKVVTRTIRTKRKGGESKALRVSLNDRVFLLNISLISDRRGKLLGTVRTLKDITELDRIDRMKTEFVSVASHELRTPLTSIKGYVDLIVEGDTGEINETQKEFLGIVQTETNRLSALVADLLDISRIESGRLKLEIGTVLLDDIVKGAIISIQPLATEREVRFITHLLQKPTKVRADRDRIEQVLVNLFSNAIKYNRVKGQVDVMVQQVSGMVQVDIKDNGVGISREDLPFLFSRFFRAHTAIKSGAGGTGLGLSISKSIVELHGGGIWVESEEGEGSTFSFNLPSAD